MLQKTCVISPRTVDVEDWFGSFLPVWNDTLLCDADTEYIPPTETYVKGNELHLRAEVPGVDPNDIDVSFNDGHVCITGERKRSAEGDDTCYCSGEMSYGKFSRCFNLPHVARTDKVRANYDHGMLDITIPLSESIEGRKIPIEGIESDKKLVESDVTDMYIGLD